MAKPARPWEVWDQPHIAEQVDAYWQTWERKGERH